MIIGNGIVEFVHFQFCMNIFGKTMSPLQGIFSLREEEFRVDNLPFFVLCHEQAGHEFVFLQLILFHDLKGLELKIMSPVPFFTDRLIPLLMKPLSFEVERRRRYVIVFFEDIVCQIGDLPLYRIDFLPAALLVLHKFIQSGLQRLEFMG